MTVHQAITALEASSRDLREAVRTIDGILAAHPVLPRVLMKLQSARSCIETVLNELRALER